MGATPGPKGGPGVSGRVSLLPDCRRGHVDEFTGWLEKALEWIAIDHPAWGLWILDRFEGIYLMLPGAL